MLVAITGGTGFIGKHLAMRCVSQGDDIRILSRRCPDPSFSDQGFHWYQGDLENKACLEKFLDGVDVLYHCAGQITDSHKMYDVHVHGTKNLIDAAQGRIGHWVQLSSVGVYGSILEGVITEESAINPMGEYEVTKSISDDLVLAAASQGKLSCTVLRPSNVFGVDMTNQSLYTMIKMIDRGMFCFIGKRGASANYIHVDNVIEGLLRCGSMPKARGKIYNLSDYSTVEAFVQYIASMLGRSSLPLRLPESLMRWVAKRVARFQGVPLTSARIDALTNRSIYSIDHIQTDLAYSHITSQEAGVNQMVAAYLCAKNDED